MSTGLPIEEDCQPPQMAARRAYVLARNPQKLVASGWPSMTVMCLGTVLILARTE
jgi:hypothetical protein